MLVELDWDGSLPLNTLLPGEGVVQRVVGVYLSKPGEDHELSDNLRPITAQ